MTKRLTALTSVLLVIAFVGCAAPTAAPGGAPQPGAGAKRETVTLQFYASMAFMAQIVEGMRRIMEEHSDWVRIEVQDTNPDEGLQIFAKATPQERKTMVPWYLETAWDQVAAGTHPAIPGQKLEQPLILFKVGPIGCSGFGTLDPNIRKFQDGAGRVLQHGRNMVAEYTDMQEALGIQMRNVAHGSDDVTVRELKNGQVDVSYLHMTGFNRPVPLLLQLMQERRGAFYHVDAKDAIEAVHQKSPGKWPHMFPMPLYQGELKSTFSFDVDPIRDPVVHCLGGRNPHFYVGPEMDHDAAYELVSTILKHRDDFALYLAGDVEAVRDTLGLVFMPKQTFHPGARKAYEDNNYAYGLKEAVDFLSKRARAHNQPLFLTPEIEKQVAEDR